MMTIKDTIKDKINQVLKKKYKLEGVDFSVEYPRDDKNGDYASNIAMVLSKKLKRSPMKIGEEVIQEIESDDIFEKVELVKPGFINFYLSDNFLKSSVGKILNEKENFGKLKNDNLQKIQIEFISANPTGPLTLANGRGGFTGDVLANVLELAGHQVQREYLVNDFGNQIKVLGHSILKDEQAQYIGDYIDKLNKKFTNIKNIDEIGEMGAKEILEKYIKPAVKRINIKFDNWFSERGLHQSGEVNKVIEWLKEKELVYKKDNAWWFCSTKFGDEKDRVIVKSNGDKTYLAGDFAYHKNKLERGFDKLINIWGADHHGDVARIKAAVEVLGHEGKLDILLMQMMRLVRGGKEVRMSKRKGEYILLEDLVDEVGLDAVRFFFLMHTNNKAMDFDLDLAKEKSSKNPVYYVQYAHARICSILKKTEKLKIDKSNHVLATAEKELISELIKWQELIKDVSQNYEVHQIAFYAVSIANKFHDFYEQCRVIEDEQVITLRLKIIKATKQVLQNVLICLGVSAPKKM